MMLKTSRPQSTAASMSFDPYLEWFRIKPSKRQGDAPPDHYTLLGVRRFEADADRIHEAALRRMQSLRQRQTGTKGDLTQRLMNEVAHARLTLTDPAKKRPYDFELEQQFPRATDDDRQSSGKPIWLASAAGLLVILGGFATYLAVNRQRSDGDAAPTVQKKDATDPGPIEQPEKLFGATKDKVVESKETKKPAATNAELTKSKPKAPPEPPGLVKLRDLPPAGESKESDGEVTHLTAVATDADEEGPTFLDPDGRLLAFQRRAGGKTQFVVAERKSADASFTAEHLIQGLPDEARLQGFVVEPGELSCIYATSDGKGLFQAKRADKSKAWSNATLLLAGGEPVLKATWPTLTTDGTRLICVQQRSGKNWILSLKRTAPQQSFHRPVELTAFGNSFTQPAIGPDGKTLVLRGPEEMYVSTWKDGASAWSPAEPVLSLRASAGANRALLQTPRFSPDGKSLLFSSNRDGGAGGFDLWSAPTSMLELETPNLSKLATKEPKTGKPIVAKKDSTTKKTTAAKPLKKPPVTVKPADEGPVRESISEWLALGPLPDGTKESVKTIERLAGFDGLELLRKMPKENQQGAGELVWKRGSTFRSEGVYTIAVSLRLKTNTDVRVVVESAPGGGVLWFDSQLGELAFGSSDLWKPLETRAKGEPLSVVAGRHRLVGVVCVADPSKPFVVKLVSAEDGTTIEGLTVSF